MDINEALVAYLKAQVGLTALIATRIYPNVGPQGCAMPYLTYLDISDIKDHALSGQVTLERPMKQFTVYAATKASASAVAKQVRLALVDYQGTMSGIEIQKIQLENELSGLEMLGDGTLKIYTHDLEFQVNYIHTGG